MEVAKQRQWIALLLGSILVALLQPHSQAEDVRLAWDPPIPPTNVSSYAVHIGTTSRQYTTVTNVGKGTNIVLKGLVPGRRYFIAASSINKQGRESRFSNELIVDVPDTYRLPVIAGITNLTLRRSQPSGVLPFRLANGVGASSNWTVEVSSSNPLLIPRENISLGGSATNRTIQISPVTGKVGIVALMLSVTDGRQTNRSSFNVTVTDTNAPPVVDAGLGTTVRTNLSFMLRGRATDDGLPVTPGRLQIQWSKASGPGNVSFGNSNYALTTIRFSSPGLYRLRLTAFDGELTSSSEVVIRAQLVSDVTPPAITNLTVTDVSPTSIKLAWTTDELADDQVKYSAAGEGIPKFSLLNQTPKLIHTATVTNLAPGTMYTLYARSRDAGGNQTFSDPVIIETLHEALLVAEAGATANNSVIPNGYAYDRDDLATDGSETAAFGIYAPLPDAYFVWARMASPSDIYQPFAVSVNLGVSDAFDPPEGSWNPSPQWVLLNGRNESAPLTLSPRTLELSAGHHTLVFSGKQARASVTRVLLSNNPDFVPADGEACCPVSSESGLPQLSLVVRSGWSMLTCPLESQFPIIASLLPNPPSGTTFFRYDEEMGTFVQNQFDGVEWEDPEMPLHAGTGGLIYNPGDHFTWILRGGFVSTADSVLSKLQTGQNFVALDTPKAGLLTKVLSGFAFQAGDSVQRMVGDNGTYQTYTYDGTSWDGIPVIDIGEAIFITLVPR